MSADGDVSPSHASHDLGQDTPQDGERREVRKRRRQILSCLPCRRLKVKCDRKLPCSHCVWSERAASCVYAPLSRRRSDSKSTRGSQVQSASSDSGLSERDVSSAPTRDSSHTQKQKPMLLPRIRAQDSKGVGSVLTSSIPMNTSGGSSSGHKDQLRGYFYNYTAWKSKFRGPTHWISLLREFKTLMPYAKETWGIIGTRLEQLEKNRRQFCYTLQSPNYPFGLGNKCDSLSKEEILSYIPDRSTTQSLVQKYIDTIERTYRLLHIPTFKDELSRFWANPTAVEDEWLAQLCMILALGYHASNVKLQSPIYNDVDRTMLDRFFSGAEASLKRTSFMFIPTITTIRTLCIMVIAKQVIASSCHELDSCAPLMAMIVRLSMSIGLHCDPEDDSTMSPFDKEIRRRLWTTIAYMELQQAMATGMLPLLRFSDFDTLPPSNINDADISPSSSPYPGGLPVRSPNEYTDSSFQIILARSFPIAFDVVCLANSPSGTLEYDQVLQYNAEIKQLIYETTLIFSNSASTSSSSNNEHEWIDLQRTMLDIFFRRILLVLHLRYAQDPSASIIYPISYWSSLECSLALLVHQRHMCEEEPTTVIQPYTRLWFAELFKCDFFIAAVIVCIQLHRKDAPTLDEMGQTGPHGMGIQMPPRQTILQTLHCCREIWARSICRSHCHFFTHLTLGKLIRTLEAASLDGHDPRQGAGAEQVMQDSLRALEECKCGSCAPGSGSVKRLYLDQSVLQQGPAWVV